MQQVALDQQRDGRDSAVALFGAACLEGKDVGTIILYAGSSCSGRRSSPSAIRASRMVRTRIAFAVT